MQLIVRLRELLRRTANPHVRQFEELARHRSLDGRRDAVLVAVGGRNLELRFVDPGRQPHRARWRIVLIHCRTVDEIELKWLSPSELDVIGLFEDITSMGPVQINRHADGATIRLPS